MSWEQLEDWIDENRAKTSIILTGIISLFVALFALIYVLDQSSFWIILAVASCFTVVCAFVYAMINYYVTECSFRLKQKHDDQKKKMVVDAVMEMSERIENEYRS